MKGQSLISTALLTHRDCLSHITPGAHPEQVDRLMAVYAAVDTLDHTHLHREDAPLARDEDILRAHPQSYIDRLRNAVPETGSVALDADTHMTPGSLIAAYRGVGAAVRAVDLVTGDDPRQLRNAFIATRPPGHHAERETAMGFCLLGNIAIAAKYALDVHKLERVAVVDFDVHHGNGTQDLLWHEPRSLFISTHQMPLFPGTGAPNDTGTSGNVMNVPLAAGSDGQALRAAYEDHILPALAKFAPRLVLISAGFDAHHADPLAGLNWNESDFEWATHQLCDIADTYAQGRVVSTLEGGYDLASLGASARAHLHVLIERGSHV